MGGRGASGGGKISKMGFKPTKSKGQNAEKNKKRRMAYYAKKMTDIRI